VAETRGRVQRTPGTAGDGDVREEEEDHVMEEVDQVQEIAPFHHQRGTILSSRVDRTHQGIFCELNSTLTDLLRSPISMGAI